MRSTSVAHSPRRELAGFALVGSSAALGYFALACALKYLGMGATLASTIAYCSFVPISYWCHRKITFSSLGRVAVEFQKFFVLSIFGIAVGVFVPHVVTDVIGFSAWVGFALVCTIVPTISYVGLRLWVFRKRRSESCY